MPNHLLFYFYCRRKINRFKSLGSDILVQFRGSSMVDDQLLRLGLGNLSHFR